MAVCTRRISSRARRLESCGRGQTPSRGVIEVKSTSDEVALVAQSEQVLRYLERYRRVLVTNYREFVLVGSINRAGRPSWRRYRLAPTRSEFWTQALHPRTWPGSTAVP